MSVNLYQMTGEFRKLADAQGVTMRPVSYVVTFKWKGGADHITLTDEFLDSVDPDDLSKVAKGLYRRFVESMEYNQRMMQDPLPVKPRISAQKNT